MKAVEYEQQSLEELTFFCLAFGFHGLAHTHLACVTLKCRGRSIRKKKKSKQAFPFTFIFSFILPPSTSSWQVMWLKCRGGGREKGVRKPSSYLFPKRAPWGDFYNEEKKIYWHLVTSASIFLLCIHLSNGIEGVG